MDYNFIFRNILLWLCIISTDKTLSLSFEICLN